MSYKHVVHRGLLPTLVVSLCSLAVWADSTPDPCSPTTSCTATCISSPCQVTVTLNGSSLSLQYNKTDASVLCAPDEGTVVWNPQMPTPSMVGLFFSPSHYPGTASILVGSTAVPASSTVTAPSAATSCYVYSVAVCGVSGTCATLDPKVVVTGTHLGKPKKKHE